MIDHARARTPGEIEKQLPLTVPGLERQVERERKPAVSLSRSAKLVDRHKRRPEDTFQRGIRHRRREQVCLL